MSRPDVSRLSWRFRHPWLIILALAGVGLLAIGPIVGMIAPGLLPGFLGVYGILLLSVTAFGYLSLFTMKVVARRRSGV